MTSTCRETQRLAAIQVQEEGLDGFFLPVGMAGDAVNVRDSLPIRTAKIVECVCTSDQIVSF